MRHCVHKKKQSFAMPIETLLCVYIKLFISSNPQFGLNPRLNTQRKNSILVNKLTPGGFE